MEGQQLVRFLCLFLGFSTSVVGLPSFYNLRVKSSIQRRPPKYVDERPLSSCAERWRDAIVDNFNWDESSAGCTTYRQRYFVCDRHWQSSSQGDTGPIFLYLGNEADVTLYLNNSGLMWENAPQFGALLVFAEHRYYGRSVPQCNGESMSLRYLSSEQALADYAELIWDLKHEYKALDAPVIGFGGSYGGMLAAWMRMKYPHLLDGAVAASAPIWNFLGEDPAFDPLSFAKGVTFDASEEGGSSPHCIDNVRAGWRVMERLGGSEEGRATLSRHLGLCPAAAVNTSEDIYEVRNWLAEAWSSMAMGNYPYPSGYILNGDGLLPAFPVRAACALLGRRFDSEQQLLQGISQAAGVFYNYSGTLECFDYRQGANEASDATENIWGYQYCTEMFMPFGQDGVHDMFWSEAWDAEAAARACEEQWGVTPRPYWATQEWGGKEIGSASRIVFSNGLLDPWHGGGVLHDVGADIHAVIIPEGAHHLDLGFSHPADPASVTAARAYELRLIAAWVGAARAEYSKLRAALQAAQDRTQGRTEDLAQGHTLGYTQGDAGQVV